MKAKISKEAKKVVENLLELYKQGDIALSDILKTLQSYNKQVLDYLIDKIDTNTAKNIVEPLQLSDMLYQRATETAKSVYKFLETAIKFKETRQNVARQIYDGYNSGDNMLTAKKVLPKYLLKAVGKRKVEEALKKQIERLKTTPLKVAYKKVAESIEKLDNKAINKTLKVSYYEKIRYYANRIAETEIHRATTYKRAKEFLEDDEVEFVKFKMSASHHILDICDYYANLNLGYGRGIVPKSEMRTLPLHPHCHCRYEPYYRRVKKKRTAKDPYRKTLENFSKEEQAKILGSYKNYYKFRSGEDPEDIFNAIRPKYPIRKYKDIIR